MARKHNCILGSRFYKNYSDEKVAKCLSAIEKGTTHRQAALEFGIPRSTILNKLSGKYNKPVGGQSTFSQEEEAMFEKCVISMSDYGFPVNEADLRHVAKDYLSKIGRTVHRFMDNYPGRDVTKSFLLRHPELSVRFVPNIKKGRATITPEILTSYINNLSKVTAGVPPENIWNYDKTNLKPSTDLKRKSLK